MPKEAVDVTDSDRVETLQVMLSLPGGDSWLLFVQYEMGCTAPELLTFSLSDKDITQETGQSVFGTRRPKPFCEFSTYFTCIELSSL